MAKEITELSCGDCQHCKRVNLWMCDYCCDVSGWPVNKNDPACISALPKNKKKMARKAIDIVSDTKRKIDKARQRGDFRPAPYFDAKAAADLCNPLNYGGNNKSAWIKKIAEAAALLLCEIETIQSIKGDGIENLLPL